MVYPEYSHIPLPCVLLIKFLNKSFLSLNVASSSTSVSSATFRYCSALLKATLLNGMLAVTDNMFQSCTSLQNAITPTTLTSVGASSFNSDSNLVTNQVIPDGYTASTLPTDAKEFIFPSTVTTVGNYAFYNCSRIVHWVFLGTPTSIGTDAFYGCTGTMHVPWSENTVSGAPWGFGGTIEYDSTYTGYDWSSAV